MPAVNGDPLAGLYTDADRKTCDQALRELAMLREAMARLREAGAPCEEQVRACDQLIADFERFKRVIFPGVP